MSLRRYINLARSNSKLLTVGILAGAVAGLSSGFGVPFFVEKVFRRIFEDSNVTYETTYLIGIASLLPAIFLVRGIASYVNQYFLQWVSQNILLDIRKLLFKKVQSLPLAYFEKRQSGDLMAKLVGDTLQVQEAIMLVARDAFIQPFTFIAGLGYLIHLSIQQREVGFILLVIILAPLIILPVQYIGKNLRRRSRELQGTLGRLTEIMAENLRGILEVRAFNLQKREKDRFHGELKNYNRFALKIAKYYHLTQPIMELLGVIMVSIAFVYSYQKDIGFSAFASMGAALYFTVDAMKRFVKMINGLQKSTGSFERIESVLIEDDSILDPEEPVTFPNVQGTITFDSVKFSYDQELALDIDQLTIPAGNVCALVGSSGAGKTTFAKLIPRFYDPIEGKILIDGIDIKTCRKDDLRSRISFVAQHPVLFNGTVFDNIQLARPEATDEEVYEAARNAYADNFIKSLPLGYDTIVGENAVRLSGGQRQRLALARAFLKNAPILILDEATSALDSDSEQKIQIALEHYAKNRTVIIIAHRFSTIRQANQIVLFENGKIRQSGTLETLLQDDVFKNLWDQQKA